jgi:hypothetical protein
MNTALISSFDAEDALIQKTRTVDDHDAIWSTIVVWLAAEEVAKIKVERFNAQDVCEQCYEVTLIS